MKKNIFGRKFSRDKNERKALIKSLLSNLVLQERIKTTEPKAKAIKGDADKIVTKVKKNGELAKRLLGDLLIPSAIDKLINDVAPRFKNRNGGYTRIIRIGKRFGDDAMVVLMEWTESKSAVPSPTPASTARKSKVQNKKTSRSLSERRKRSSSKTTAKKSRRLVAPGKVTAQKRSKNK